MSARPAILITGGAGYIGGHFALACLDAGYGVVVVDNLSTGSSVAIPHGCAFHEVDVRDRGRLNDVFNEHAIAVCAHFAGKLSVPESVSAPLSYYSNNVDGLLTMLDVCNVHGVDKFIFSSTAAVYGNVPNGCADESAATTPISPYGRSKLMGEVILSDVARATRLRYVALRYFNVAGADPLGRFGQGPKANKHLIKAACETALGVTPSLKIFGTDYDTADGTCVRDFIHVADLVDAHLKAMDYLIRGGPSVVLNCGYGHGHSVLEVVAAVGRALGRTLSTRVEARRDGDPPMLVADISRIQSTLGWQPAYDDLETIVTSALNWERLNQDRERSVSPRKAFRHAE